MEKTMCRIDAPFGNITFDEKNDPKERFVQALDEFDIQGNLRLLLIKHFSDNWQNVFRGVSELEEALSQTKQSNSESENCIAFLLTQKTTLSNSILRHFEMFKLPVNDSSVIAFLKDVAKAYYPNSPYGLFNDGLSKVEGHYFLFVSWLYGKDFCFSKEFFDDQSLNSLSKSERTSVLWSHFNAMAHQFRSREGSMLIKELIYIASSNSLQGPPTKDSLDIMRGLDFIKAWLKFDSQGGRLSYSWIDFFYDYDSPWEQLETLIRYERSDCEETSKLLTKWLEATKLEFEKLIYVNADLNLISAEGQEQWAKGIESYYISYTNDFIYCDYEYSQLTNDDLNIRLSNAHHDLCSELNPMQISTWIKYSVDCDFQRVIDSKQTRSDLLNSAEKWVSTEYFIAWKKIFLESFNNLVIENQLCVLSSCSPCKRGQSKEFYSEFSTWWNEIFTGLIDTNDFPKSLIPDWTVLAVDRLKREDVLPYIDKSIGILRGELVKAEKEENIKIYHQKLERLLNALDHTSSKKALRHRLLLMRSSKESFSNESISKFGSPFQRENFYKWYDSLKQLSDSHFAYQTNGNREVTQENYSQVQNDFYVNFSHELVEFFLSRLRLRKGEKAKDGQYDSSQVVEQSSVWRQGYLKALTELGFDLNGKVHKTVNFTKKSDPNEGVRSIASECYKAVRRHAKKSPTLQDLKRGIIAAEWWLLLCQRQELLGPESVDYEAALKTRRNLMRNP
jgi:hypothetical protein